MTETNEIKTFGINMLQTAVDGGRNVLYVGLKPAYQDKPQYQKALKAEYDKYHEVDHPNIIKYLTMKDVEGYGTCIEMEWETCRSLTDFLKEGHSSDEKKRVVRQVAEALGFMHDKGLVHGALTPSAIFITNSGDNVKILNFHQRYADRMHQPASDLKFIAPEAKDGTVAPDARTDIYSLGVLLKDMGFGLECSQVIENCCSYGRNDRYTSTKAFLDSLNSRHSGRRRESNSSGNSKKPAIIVATVAVLAFVAAYILLNRESSDTEATPPQTEVAANTSNPPEQATTNVAPAENPAPNAEVTTAVADTPAEAYTGDLDFLNTLLPQMYIDLDKIYAANTDKAVIKKKVASYYKGLRKHLGLRTEEQFTAYDKAFAAYINKKNTALN